MRRGSVIQCGAGEGKGKGENMRPQSTNIKHVRRGEQSGSVGNVVSNPWGWWKKFHPP